MTSEQMKQNVMRRVQLIFLMRKAMHPFVLKGAVFIVLAGSAGFLVSLENVFANMPRVSNIGALSQFYMNAFLNTEFVVQAVLAGVATLSYLLVKDIAATVSKRKRSLAFVK